MSDPANDPNQTDNPVDNPTDTPSMADVMTAISTLSQTVSTMQSDFDKRMEGASENNKKLLTEKKETEEKAQTWEEKYKELDSKFDRLNERVVEAAITNKLNEGELKDQPPLVKKAVAGRLRDLGLRYDEETDSPVFERDGKVSTFEEGFGEWYDSTEGKSVRLTKTSTGSESKVDDLSGNIKNPAKTSGNDNKYLNMSQKERIEEYNRQKSELSEIDPDLVDALKGKS